MPLDPQAKAMLEQMAATGARPRNLLTPEEARKEAMLRRGPAGPPEPVWKVEDRVIPGPRGDLKVRIYTPEGEKPLPLLVYFHGGGFVLGNLDSHDAPCRMFANAAGCIVASVDYRLAPEQKFPAAVEDAYAATCWVAENAAALGGDRGRLAVSGNSSGANLAAVVALMARDKGGPALMYQLLLYPLADHDVNRPSCIENAEGYGLTRNEMIWFDSHYLRTPEDALDPYASPVLAPDLSGLPPAVVVTAEHDPLRDSGAAYAERLKGAGVPTIYKCEQGMIHGFFRHMSSAGVGKDALRESAAILREAFAR